MKPPLESAIQKQCLQYLGLRGAFPIRINSGGMRGTHNGKEWFMRFNSAKGCSDILAVFRGRFLALEVKRPGNKPTADQEAFLAQVRQAGGVAEVVHSVDELAAVLERVLGEEG